MEVGVVRSRRPDPRVVPAGGDGDTGGGALIPAGVEVRSRVLEVDLAMRQ